jgi:hypothetical protein
MKTNQLEIQQKRHDNKLKHDKKNMKTISQRVRQRRLTRQQQQQQTENMSKT